MDIDVQSIIKAFFSPWWQPIAWLLALSAAFLSVRIALTVNLTDLLIARQKRKDEKSRAQRVEETIDNCPHLWARYPQSPLAVCERCDARIGRNVLNQYAGDKNVEIVEAQDVVTRNLVIHNGGIRVPSPYNNVVRPTQGDTNV